jgi:carbonic anhydrase
MARFDEFREANERYAASFDRGDLPTPPARGVAVVTCMDARLHSEKFLGLEEIVRIRHTDYNMLTLGNDDLTAKIKEDLGVDTTGRDFPPFADLEQSMCDDVETLRTWTHPRQHLDLRRYLRCK